ncbi:MAG: sigma factor-like helix-turn-helix DNA-binding protein [Acutalibacteraceae bacterium]
MFLRYYYFYQPVSTIAEEMGLESANVKTKLFRGRKKLKEVLEKGVISLKLKISDMMDDLPCIPVEIGEKEFVTASRIRAQTMQRLHAEAAQGSRSGGSPESVWPRRSSRPPCASLPRQPLSRTSGPASSLPGA